VAAKIDPIVKWAGGKRWLAPALDSMRRLSGLEAIVEPFAGGMAFALYDPPRFAVINDTNRHLINLYRVMARSSLPVGFDWKNTEARYYAVREEFNARVVSGADHGPDAAAMFLYLNRNGYNGLCRYSNDGKYNVPWGKYKKSWQPEEESLVAFAGLRDWHYSSCDFSECFIPANSFVYYDPPFAEVYGSYQPGGFGKAQHEEIARVAIGREAGMAVVSNNWIDWIVAMHRDYGFSVIAVEAPRRISCTGDRTPATEMLAWVNGPKIDKVIPTGNHVYTAKEITERIDACLSER